MKCPIILFAITILGLGTLAFTPISAQQSQTHTQSQQLSTQHSQTHNSFNTNSNANNNIYKNSSQLQNDTLWATGTFATKEEGTTAISGALISCTPYQMQGDTLPNYTWSFISSSNGFIPFKLPVYIDLETKITQQTKSDTQALVFPNPGSDFTFIFPGKALSDVNVYDLQGKHITNTQVDFFQEKSLSGTYIDLSSQANGVYVLSVATPHGMISKKVVKNSDTKQGYSFFDASHSFDDVAKSTFSSFSAKYIIDISREGYYDFKDTITLDEGNNGLITFIMSPLPGIPQYRFIGGRIYDESGYPLSDATVRIYDKITDTLISQTFSQFEGEYLLPVPVSAGSTFYFEVGGISDKFAFRGDESSVPVVISTLEDTLKSVYHFTLYDKLRQVPGESSGVTVSPSALEVWEMVGGSNVEFSLRDSILFYFNPSWSEEAKNIIRARVENGMVLFGIPGAFVEVNYALNNVNFENYHPYNNFFPGQIGVNVSPGGDATSPIAGGYLTLLGNLIGGTLAANMTLSGVETATYKEFFGRVFSLGSVTSRSSFMNLSGNPVNFLDRAIANLVYSHYINVWKNSTAYFRLNNITEDLLPLNTLSSNTPPQEGE